MVKLLLGGAIIGIGLLYIVAVALALFGSGDGLHPNPGITFDTVVTGLVLLPVGVVAIGAGLSVLRAAR